jgi:hypothetical protein
LRFLKFTIYFISTLIIVFHSSETIAQVSSYGIPPSFGLKGLIPDPGIHKLKSLNIDKIIAEDVVDKKNGSPYRYAVNIPVDLRLDNSGTWTDLDNGDRIWQLKVESPGALAIALYYRGFYMPEGGEFFVYNESKTKVLGAFTSLNNKPNAAFATQLLLGDVAILEYYEPASSRGQGIVSVSEVSHAYRSVAFAVNAQKDFGDSDFCEININCPEGSDWQDEKRGVARISVKMGINSYWCTGSLINNVRQDFTPYFLTADHCGTSATAWDFSHWVFYFNYESNSCNNPSAEPQENSVSGCKKIANGGSSGSTGSDFLLLELLEEIPEEYNVYYNGWNNGLSASSGGVTVHHPNGDIKKISTYTKTAVSTNWNGSPYQSHWKVYWATTSSGHGVTEGGSSGSPLFNNDGEIVGTLTGGAAACEDGGAGPGTGPNQPDYYGKFSYHWKSNGDNPYERLRDWLDPDDTQAVSLRGLNIYPTPDFIANNTSIDIGGKISFTDVSTGIPPNPANVYTWEFEGGEPATSNDLNPTGIKYDKAGVYDVTLEIKLQDTTLSVTKSDFIHVIDDVVVFPNPTRDEVYIDMMGNEAEDIEIFVFNTTGQEVKYLSIDKAYTDIISLGSFELMPSGIYFISVRTPHFTQHLKLTLNK